MEEALHKHGLWREIGRIVAKYDVIADAKAKAAVSSMTGDPAKIDAKMRAKKAEILAEIRAEIRALWERPRAFRSRHRLAANNLRAAVSGRAPCTPRIYAPLMSRYSLANRRVVPHADARRPLPISTRTRLLSERLQFWRRRNERHYR
jgi:hypothetical protein